MGGGGYESEINGEQTPGEDGMAWLDEARDDLSSLFGCAEGELCDFGSSLVCERDSSSVISKRHARPLNRVLGRTTLMAHLIETTDYGVPLVVTRYIRDNHEPI